MGEVLAKDVRNLRLYRSERVTLGAYTIRAFSEKTGVRMRASEWLVLAQMIGNAAHEWEKESRQAAAKPTRDCGSGAETARQWLLRRAAELVKEDTQLLSAGREIIGSSYLDYLNARCAMAGVTPILGTSSKANS